MDARPVDDPRLPVSDRLLRAAQRLDDLLGTGAGTGADSVLRRDQLPVFRSAAEYLVDVATRPAGETRRPSFACIVQPPRTGKTVVALIAGGFRIPDAGLAQNSIDVRRGLSSLPGLRPG